MLEIWAPSGEPYVFFSLRLSTRVQKRISRWRVVSQTWSDINVCAQKVVAHHEHGARQDTNGPATRVKGGGGVGNKKSSIMLCSHTKRTILTELLVFF